MHQLPTRARLSLSKLVTQILPSSSSLVNLSLRGFSEKDPAQVESMLQALASAESVTMLEHLDLSDNSELWRRNEAIEALLEQILPRQAHLKRLTMEHSYFTSELTESLLGKLVQTARLK